MIRMKEVTFRLLMLLLGSAIAKPCPNMGGKSSSPLDVANGFPDLSITYELMSSCSSDGTGNGLLGCRMHSIKQGWPERTMFLPTNKAWISYLERTGTPLAALLAPSHRSQLTELLRGHVVVEVLTTDNRLLVKDDSQYVKFRTARTDERSLEVLRLSPGHQLSVAAGEGVGRVEGRTLQADIPAGPAVFHIIDSVLEPGPRAAASSSSQSSSSFRASKGMYSSSVSVIQATAAERRRAQSYESMPPPPMPRCNSTSCPLGQTCLKGRCVGGGKLRFSVVWDHDVGVNIVVQSPDAAAAREDGGVKDVSSGVCTRSWSEWTDWTSWMANAGSVESFAYYNKPSRGRYHVCAAMYPLGLRCNSPGPPSTTATLYITAPDNGNPAGRTVLLGPKTLKGGSDPGYCDPSNAGYLGSVDWCDGAQCAPTCVNPATNATKTCEPDQVCRPSDGACVRPCGGRICSPGQTCIRSPDLSNPSLEPGCVTEGQLRFTLATQHPAFFAAGMEKRPVGDFNFQVQTPKLKVIGKTTKSSGGGVFEAAEGGPLAPQNIFCKSNAPSGRYHVCALFRKEGRLNSGGDLGEAEMGIITSVTSSLTVVGNAPSAASPSLTRVDPPVQLGKLEDELYLPEMTGGCYPGRAGYLASVDWCPIKNKPCGETCGNTTCPLGQACRAKDKTCVEPCGTTVCAVGRTCVRNSPYMPPTCATDGKLRFTLLWNMTGAQVSLLLQPPYPARSSKFTVEKLGQYAPASAYWKAATPPSGAYYVCALVEPPARPDNYYDGMGSFYRSSFATEFYVSPSLNISAVAFVPKTGSQAARTLSLPWRTVQALEEPSYMQPPEILSSCSPDHPGYLGSVKV